MKLFFFFFFRLDFQDKKKNGILALKQISFYISAWLQTNNSKMTLTNAHKNEPNAQQKNNTNIQKGKRLKKRSKKCWIQHRRAFLYGVIRQPGQNMAFHENPIIYEINFTYLQSVVILIKILLLVLFFFRKSKNRLFQSPFTFTRAYMVEKQNTKTWSLNAVCLNPIVHRMCVSTIRLRSRCYYSDVSSALPAPPRSPSPDW